MSFLVIAKMREDYEGDYDVKCAFNIDDIQSSEWALQVLDFYRNDEPEGIFKLFHLACMEDVLVENKLDEPFVDVEEEVKIKWDAGKA